jgi:regulation of enolase protein 1 (concanavalin A-like superfamily)
MTMLINFENSIAPDFQWLNEPSQYTVNNGLHITTDPETDFWQRTHYGFRNDNGHCLLTRLSGDFQLTTAVEFHPQNAYDQCGLFVRVDAENWIKASVEYINPQLAELGSVVTNLGYSDWATTEISPDIHRIWYRISRRGPDFLLQNSYDGEKWVQMRITHLHAAPESLEAGIYACSPANGRFQCTFEQITIAANEWRQP